MTTDEVKNRLRAYRPLRNECDSLKKRIERKRDDMNYLQAIVTDGAPRSGGISHSVERTVERMDALVRKYERRLAECEAVEMEIQHLIEQAPEGLCRQILELRYIDGMSFDDIPSQLYISSRTMWRHYNKAIDWICKNGSEWQ